MPISISNDDSNSLTLFTVTGELTFDQQMAALRAFYDGSPTANVIWDFRQLEGSRVTTAELHRIVEFVKAQQSARQRAKTALIAATDLDFGLSRMSQAFAQVAGLSHEIQVFRSMDDAMRWIDETQSGDNG